MKRHSTHMLAWRLAAVGALMALSACAFPKRDYNFMPDESIIKVQADAQGRLIAVPPHCGPLFPEKRQAPLDSRPQAAFGCATYTNLANTIADPADLIAPRPYANQDAEDAAGAVQRYHQNRVTPLRETGTLEKN